MQLQPSITYKIKPAASASSVASDDASIPVKYKVIPLKLNQELLKTINDGARNLDMGLVFDPAEGNDLVLEYGRQAVHLLSADSSAAATANSGNANANNVLWKCAEMSQNQFSTLGGVEVGKWSMPPSALMASRLKQTADEEKKVKLGRSSMFLDKEPGRAGSIKKKSSGSSGIVRNLSSSTSKSPLIGRRSPLIPAAAIPVIPPPEKKASRETAGTSVTVKPHTPRTAGSSRGQVDLKEVETRLVHILACKPFDVDDCMVKTSLSRETVLSILEKIGFPQASNPKLFQLKPESYKLLNPWRYEAYTPQERIRAIKNATIAFDSLLHLPKDAFERKRLVPPPGTDPSLLPPASKGAGGNGVGIVVMDRRGNGSSSSSSVASSISSLSPSAAGIGGPSTTTTTSANGPDLNANGTIRIKRKMTDTGVAVGGSLVSSPSSPSSKNKKKKHKTVDLANTTTTRKTSLDNIVAVPGDVTARKRTSSGMIDASAKAALSSTHLTTTTNAPPPLSAPSVSATHKSPHVKAASPSLKSASPSMIPSYSRNGSSGSKSAHDSTPIMQLDSIAESMSNETAATSNNINSNPSTSTKKILDASEWKQLSNADLSKYFSFLLARKSRLLQKLESILKVSQDLVHLLDPTLGTLSSNTTTAAAAHLSKSEAQKLGFIKTRLARGGFGGIETFMGLCVAVKEALEEVNGAVKQVEGFVLENDGIVLLEELLC